MVYGFFSTLEHWIGDAFLLYVVESEWLKICEECPHREQCEHSSQKLKLSDSTTERINNRGYILLKHRISANKHVLKYPT